MMNRFRWVCVVAGLLFSTTAYSDDAKNADILRLIEASGGMASGEQMAGLFTNQMTQVLRSSGAEVPPAVLDAMPQAIMAIISERMPELAQMIVPVYDKHFTHEEVLEMLAFYQTDVGKKFVGKLPEIMAESSQMGQQWGMSIGPEIQRRISEILREQGVDLSGGQ